MTIQGEKQKSHGTGANEAPYPSHAFKALCFQGIVLIAQKKKTGPSRPSATDAPGSVPFLRCVVLVVQACVVIFTGNGCHNNGCL